MTTATDTAALWILLDDLELNARHVLGAPRNALARAELRRASDRAAAFRKIEAARHSLAQAAPEETREDPRPDPEPESALAPEGPLGMPPGYRAPFKED